MKSIGFLGYNSAKGWTNIQQYLKKEPAQLNVIYKFAKLDQYELYDKLNTLSDAELKQISQKEIRYPWIFIKIMKERNLAD